MLGNYFRELLEKHNRVIIPDFGAFLVKDTGDTRSIANTSFSPFLRYNDGLMEAFVAEKQDLTKAEATNKVKEYVDSLKERLGKGVQVELPNLGYFYQDSRGTIQFQLDLTGSGFTPIIKEEEKAPITETVHKENAPIEVKVEPKQEIEVIAPVEPASISVTDETPQKEKEQPLKQKVIEKKAAVKASSPTKKTEIKATKSVPTPTPMAQATNKKSSSSKSSKNYWLLLIGLIAILLVLIWQYDNIVKVFNNNGPSKAIIDSTPAIADSLSTDSTKSKMDTSIAPTKQTAPVYVKPIIDKPENKFLVVVGSFSRKQNAENQLKKLSEQGYQPIIIVRSNGMYSVVISGHTTKEEAKLSLESYNKKNGDGWIMTR